MENSQARTAVQPDCFHADGCTSVTHSAWLGCVLPLHIMVCYDDTTARHGGRRCFATVDDTTRSARSAATARQAARRARVGAAADTTDTTVGAASRRLTSRLGQPAAPPRQGKRPRICSRRRVDALQRVRVIIQLFIIQLFIIQLFIIHLLFSCGAFIRVDERPRSNTSLFIYKCIYSVAAHLLFSCGAFIVQLRRIYYSVAAHLLFSCGASMIQLRRIYSRR